MTRNKPIILMRQGDSKYGEHRTLGKFGEDESEWEHVRRQNERNEIDMA